MTFDILHLDNHLLVINKPAGLLSQEDQTGDPDVISIGKAYLKEKFDKPGNVFLGLVHRLDRPASGVMVLARTSKAAGRLSEQFRERSPDKIYLALAQGHIETDGRLEDYLVKDDQGVRVVDASEPGARHAVLQYAVGGRGSWRGQPVTLLEVRLETGRAHQIRVQFASRGHALIGDFRYGSSTELDGKNLALHACAITIEHPTRREQMTFKAPPPESWGGDFDDDIARILSDI